jgi:EAL domain-containing protein (putative c-di-GMP-specific phosphodiesterase class I)
MGPEHFIHRVSSMGKTVPFTRAILKSAMGALHKRGELHEGFKVNFNVFPNDLTEDNLARLLSHKTLFSTRFNICFEITEDEPFNNKQSHFVLQRLKELGAEIAIDDFGTGYSNLDQLQSIPFDYLKIDRGFCKGLESSSFRANLIPQIVKIAQILGVSLVAEGVETEKQRKMLIKESIEYGQGFLFGRPMPASSLDDLLAKQNATDLS